MSSFVCGQANSAVVCWKTTDLMTKSIQKTEDTEPDPRFTGSAVPAEGALQKDILYPNNLSLVTGGLVQTC